MRVQMTAMPELVALFNGFGGGASVLVAAASYTQAVDLFGDTARLSSSAALASLIGAVTFTGSLVAFAKLRESSALVGVQRDHRAQRPCSGRSGGSLVY